MANEVEQLLIDAQRALNERGVAHRSAVTDVMNRVDEATAIYIEKLNDINTARHKLDEEGIKAFEQFRDTVRSQMSTLVLVRDMHPVLLEEGGEQKKIANGSKKS